MSKTRILLGSALLLSLIAFMSMATEPHDRKPGEVIVSSGRAVRLEARPSHTAVHQQGSEIFVELTVTLEGPHFVNHWWRYGGANPADQQIAKQISLALVLDTSGSMSGAKMDDAKKAAHRLVDLLTETDELALISFGSELTTVPR